MAVMSSSAINAAISASLIAVAEIGIVPNANPWPAPSGSTTVAPSFFATQYFHVVLTLPEEIAAIAHQNKATVYGILFRAAAETLQTIAADPKHLGAEIGFFAVLHTWGQTLGLHPHLHCVVTGGGLSPDGARWVSCRPGFFLPVRVLSRLFRRLFLEYLQKAFDAGKLRFFSSLEPLREPGAFRRYLAPLRRAPWVVFAKPPFAGPEQVLDYVGRYTHRVAISNNRLCDIEDGKVCFTWKDYRDHNRQKVMTVAADEFIRRFLLHVLPEGFHRIRYYGFLGNRHRAQKLARCRELLGMAVPEPGATPRGAGLPPPLRRTQWPFSYAMPGLPPRADDHHRNDHRRHDKAADPGHLMMATHFHRCGMGSICLARSSHGDALCRSAFAQTAIETPVFATLLRNTASTKFSPLPAHVCQAIRPPFRPLTAIAPHSTPIAPTSWGRLSPTRF